MPWACRRDSLPSKPPLPSSTPRRARTSTAPSSVVAHTPTTWSPVASVWVIRSRTQWPVRMVPPASTKVAASRAMSACPPLRVPRPSPPTRSRSTGGRTSAATSVGRVSRLMLVGWMERPIGQRPGAS